LRRGGETTSGADTSLTAFLGRIADREARIGVVGLGYVGLPLAQRFAEVGFRVTGFDTDTRKVEALEAGRSYIEHIQHDTVAEMRAHGFEATADMGRAAAVDALVLCVPTPLNRYREPDLSFVRDTMRALAPALRAAQLVSLESTTWPGTTEEELKPMIEAQGLVVGRDVFLVYSPEREDPGNTRFTTATIPRVVGGCSEACLDAGEALYGAAIERIVRVSSPRTAEMTKLVENIQRTVNIGLANEMKLVCSRMGVDVFEVVDAAATKPFGFQPYYPGPGIGGHCLPIDPFYLTWKAREYGLHTRFIELAGEINAAMPDRVVAHLVDALNDRGRALRGSAVLVLGVAYKPNVDDCRESPAVEIMERVREKGAELAYSDPHVPVFPMMREHRFALASTALDPVTLARFDAVVLVTDHARFDYGMIRDHARLIIDTRGTFDAGLPHVVRA
jgi:UDP-N-acetyl-D-glucosamine dehydrogenase